MMIKLGKQYQTRDGCEARIYALDAGGQNPVHGAIKRNGLWIVTAWAKEGQWSMSKSINDLIEVTPRIRREVWVNVCRNEVNDEWYFSRQTADEQSLSSRIACVKVVIDCEEGEGL
jgi:hypothetical protein